MAKVKSYGKPYNKPNRQPTFRFLNTKTSTTVEAFETWQQVEVYQTRKDNEQRVVMTNSQFDNFYNTLLNNGFALA
jgi:hypothetical protein